MQDSNPSVFVFLGPPGSGKGTQAKKLSSWLQIPHISTGDLMRTYAKKDPELAQVMDRGEFASDALILRLLSMRIEEEDCSLGFILDGFPRNLAQAKALDERFTNQANLVFVEVQLDDRSILNRLSGRRTCTTCSKIYHTLYSPPSQTGVCDACSSELYTRTDDTPAVILNRLEIFKREFEPMIQYYANRMQWVTLSASGSLDECFSSLTEQLIEKVPQLTLNTTLAS